MEHVCEYAFSSPTQQTNTTKVTLFGAYNAITGYFQNVRQYKDDDVKLKSILFGSGFSKSQTAFNLCREFERRGDEVFAVN